jgi:hypothetical protein
LRRPHRLGYQHAPALEVGELESEKSIVRINSSGADFVWVGLGLVKQDWWIARHRPLLTATGLIVAGAAFDADMGVPVQSRSERVMEAIRVLHAASVTGRLMRDANTNADLNALPISLIKNGIEGIEFLALRESEGLTMRSCRKAPEPLFAYVPKHRPDVECSLDKAAAFLVQHNYYLSGYSVGDGITPVAIAGAHEASRLCSCDLLALKSARVAAVA